MESKTAAAVIAAAILAVAALALLPSGDVLADDSDDSEGDVYYFFIQMLEDADLVESDYYTQQDLETGFTITGTGDDAAEALSNACAANNIDLELYYSDTLFGWIDAMFGLGDVYNAEDDSWTYWIQYRYDETEGEYTYNEWTLGYYTGGGYFMLLYGTTSFGVTINNAPDSALTVGDEVQLLAYLTPDNIRTTEVTWESSDTNVAEVDENGLLTAVGEGTADITVTCNASGYEGSTWTITVTVEADPSVVASVSLDRESALIAVGDGLQLTATVSPDTAEDQSVEWASSDESVATVDGSGLVTAVSVGTATITVTTSDGGFTATCSVTVASAVYTVTYLDDGDSTYSETEEVAEGGSASGPSADPSREGYCLIGWTDADGNVVDLSAYEVTADVVLYALYGEHSYEAVVTDPTCTEQGYTTYTCSVCGDTYVDDYVDATGHSYEAVVTDPTCTEQGYTTYTCSVCGDSYVDDYTEATGHDYELVDGSYVCSVCGDSYDASDDDTSDDSTGDADDGSSDSDDSGSDSSGTSSGESDDSDDDSGSLLIIAVVIVVLVVAIAAAAMYYKKR